MREILFRGKNIEGGWIYGYVCQLFYLSPIKSCSLGIMERGNKQTYEVDRNTVDQYISIQDIKGTRIFENDIISYTDTTDYFPPVRKGIVIFDNEGFCGFCVSFASEHEKFCKYALSFCKDIEVIGNTTDNPNFDFDNEVKK